MVETGSNFELILFSKTKPNLDNNMCKKNIELKRVMEVLNALDSNKIGINTSDSNTDNDLSLNSLIGNRHYR